MGAAAAAAAAMQTVVLTDALQELMSTERETATRLDIADAAYDLPSLAWKRENEGRG